MGIQEKVVKVLIKLMKGWKTRLEVTQNGKVKTSRSLNILKGFLQGDSYATKYVRNKHHLKEKLKE